MTMPTYLSTPIAARLLYGSEADLAELVRSGRIRKFGGKHGHFLTADLAALRAQLFPENATPIDAAELAFAEAMHARRKASYARQNQKRTQQA